MLLPIGFYWRERLRMDYHKIFTREPTKLKQVANEVSLSCTVRFCRFYFRESVRYKFVAAYISGRTALIAEIDWALDSHGACHFDEHPESAADFIIKTRHIFSNYFANQLWHEVDPEKTVARPPALQFDVASWPARSIRAWCHHWIINIFEVHSYINSGNLHHFGWNVDRFEWNHFDWSH